MHDEVEQRRRSALALEMRKTPGSSGSAASVVRGCAQAAPSGHAVHESAVPLAAKKPALQKQSSTEVEPASELAAGGQSVHASDSAHRSCGATSVPYVPAGHQLRTPP